MEKTRKEWNWKIMKLSLLLVILLTSFNKVYAQENISVSTDKQIYVLEEIVNIITIAPSGSTLEIISDKESFRLFGDVNGTQKFIPSTVGSFKIMLISELGQIIGDTSFNVTNTSEIIFYDNDSMNNSKMANNTDDANNSSISNDSLINTDINIDPNVNVISQIDREFLESGKQMISSGRIPAIIDSKGFSQDASLKKIMVTDKLGRNQLQINHNETNQTYTAEYDFLTGPINVITIKGIIIDKRSNIGLELLDTSSVSSSSSFNSKNKMVAFAINLEEPVFEIAYAERVAVGNQLYKCALWNFTNQSCSGVWTEYMNLTPGQAYNITLFPGDPGYVETYDSNIAIDIDITALDENTIILAWIDSGTNYSSFEIWNTNGTRIVDQVDIDTDGNWSSRIAVSAINKTQFVIAIDDGPLEDLVFWIYDRNGNIVVARTTPDTAIGTISDVDVCQMGDRWPLINANSADSDADFRIYSNAGVSIVGESNVDGTIAPTERAQNLVSCGVLNSTYWAYAYFDDSDKDVSAAIRDGAGTSIVGAFDIDVNAGERARVAVTGIRQNRIALIYHNSSNGGIYMSVRTAIANLPSVRYNTRIDMNNNTDSRVAIAEVEYSNQSYFVAAWYARNDTTIKAAVYNSTGIAITPPFNISTYANVNFPLIDVIGRSSTLNNGLCNATFAITYTNRTNTTVYETYWYNGSRWDGICPDTITPNITLNDPTNNSEINSSTVDFNFTVTDDRSTVLPNCTLYHNVSGSWQRNNTITNIQNNTETNITLTRINDGRYLWNVICLDNASNNAFYRYNFTANVNAYGPNTTVPAQINVTLINQSMPVKFNVSFNDIYGVDVALITLQYPNGTHFNYTLVTSGTEYYNIINNTTQVGIFNITMIFSNDTYGKETINLTTGLYFTVTAGSPSIFDLLAPANATESRNILPNLSWQQVVEANFANYTILIDQQPDFATPDISYANPDITNTTKQTDIALEANAIYYWRVIAYDVFDNLRNSTNDFVYITDRIPPNTSLYEPENGSYVTAAKTSFRYNAEEINTLRSCTLYGNFTGIFTSNESNTTPINNDTNWFNTTLPEGEFIWNIMCNDSAGNQNFSSTNYTFTIDRTGPNISLLWPLNNTILNRSNNVNFTAEVVDVWANTSNCTLIINEAEQQTLDVSDGINFTFVKFLNNEEYNWSVSCFDVNGNNRMGPRYNVSVLVVDNNPPLITLNYPDNEDFLSTNNIRFNYTVEDATGIENCSIYMDGKLNRTNTSVLNQDLNYFNISGITDGKHNWSIECYDNTTEENRRMSSTRNFTADTQSPTVNLIYPYDDSFVISYIQFNYTPEDGNLVNCTLYTNESGAFSAYAVNTTPVSGAPNGFEGTFNDGTLLWNVLCADLAGRFSFSVSNYTVKIDTSPPNYYNVTSDPESGTMNDDAAIYTFNATWIDMYSVDKVVFENNFWGTSTNQTINLVVGIFNVSFTGLAAGTYYYRWHSNDTLNYQNSTGFITYQVSKANSSIKLTLNGSQSSMNIVEDTFVNITAKLIQPGFGNILVYNESLIISDSASPSENITFFPEPGVFNVTAKYIETQNYTSSEVSLYVIVNDTALPSISIVQPLNNTLIATGTISLQYNVTDSSSVDNCTLYFDGLLNQTNFTVQRDIPQGFEVNVPSGNHSWYIRCYDNATNSYITHKYNFTAKSSNNTLVNVYAYLTEYEKGEPATIIANTTDGFNNLVNATVTIDIIQGNTTLSWWNYSWKYRQPILLTQNVSRDRNIPITINITGLRGNITNCTELRLVRNDSYNHVVEPYHILVANNSDFCTIKFNAYISSAAVNQSSYYIYYGSPGASNNSTTIPVSGIFVQRGNSTGTTSQLIRSIQQVDTSKAFLLFTSSTASSAPNAWQFTGSLSSTQVQFDKYAAGTASTIYWQVIQGEDLTVQSNTMGFAAGTAELNVTISPVNLSSSFITVSGRVSSGTGNVSPEGMFRAYFYNSTLIIVRREATTAAATAVWQVVDWKNSKVQYTNVSFTGTAANARINATELARSFVVMGTSVSGATSTSANTIAANISNATNVNITRVTAAGTANANIFVVELPQEYIIQRRSHTAAAVDTTIAVIPVERETSFHAQTWTSSSNTNTYANAQAAVNLTNSTALVFDKTSGTGTLVYHWHLISLIPAFAAIEPRERLVYNFTNDTGSLGSLSSLWDTMNSSIDLYSLVATAYRNGYDTGYSYNDVNVTPDGTAPNVTLLAPPNFVGYGAGTFEFNYTPFDYNLKNCTLYLNINGVFTPNESNTSPINNGNNSFSNIYLGAGLYDWNVRCFDTEGNSGFATANFTLNVTGPDLTISSSSIWFTNSTPIEGDNITIFANITNAGITNANDSFIVQFYREDPDLSGVYIMNITLLNLSIGETVTINTSYIVAPGTNNIYVKIDPENNVNESDEWNNKAFNSFTVSLYQYFYGNVSQKILLGNMMNFSLVDFINVTTIRGNIYFADADSSFSFTDLQALTRNVNGNPTANDLTDADANLNSAGFIDSIKNIWGKGTDTPAETTFYNVSDVIIENTPVTNSTNTTSFKTGILWDMADDTGNLQYDTVNKEDLVFVTKINSSNEGSFGIYDYEIKVPANLKDYKSGNSNLIFYVEIE